MFSYIESCIAHAFRSRRATERLKADVRAFDFVGPPSLLCQWLSPTSFLVISLLLLPLLSAISLIQSRSTPILQDSRLIQLPSSPSQASECSNPAYNNCSFYADCLETRYNCGPTGYPIGYGQHFCETFRSECSKLSDKGQTWMLNTMHCLQMALVPEAMGKDDTTCSALEDKAFATHAGCYVNSGLCTLPLTDWLVVVEIVQLKTLFQSWDAFKATVEAGEGCLSFGVFLVEQNIFEGTGNGYSF